MTKSDLYAVFGQPIGHSLSPIIHKTFAEQTGQNLLYQAREVGLEHFTEALARFVAEGGRGLNCTVPLKELAWRQADVLTPRARLSGAVNTLIRQAEGGWLGDNTDGVGLCQDLTQQGVMLAGKRLLIIGAGGAARGIVQPLAEAGVASIAVVNRTRDKAVRLAETFQAVTALEVLDFAELDGRTFDVLINATSLSLSGEAPPLPAGCLHVSSICYDLAYNLKAPTPFVRWARMQGAAYSLDGIGMLVAQAAEAFYLWRGIRPDTRPVLASLIGAGQVVGERVG
ncbi:MAG: shikimate dehydrogenase [Methylococcales bacterium]|nr:shikimate dehydrogenase [Methylococcales bacterium]